MARSGTGTGPVPVQYQSSPGPIERYRGFCIVFITLLWCYVDDSINYIYFRPILLDVLWWQWCYTITECSQRPPPPSTRHCPKRDVMRQWTVEWLWVDGVLFFVSIRGQSNDYIFINRKRMSSLRSSLLVHYWCVYVGGSGLYFISCWWCNWWRYYLLPRTKLLNSFNNHKLEIRIRHN